MFKKIFLALAIFSIIVPLAASAQTADGQSRNIADLERLIADLTAQIKRIQGQTNTGTAAWCHSFNRNLGVGANDDEVSYLYGALMRLGLITAGSENGIRNNENIYDEHTAALVSRFQQKFASEILIPNGFNAPTGYFGPATRAKMNRLYGCNTKVPIPMPYPLPAPVMCPADARICSNGTSVSRVGPNCEFTACP